MENNSVKENTGEIITLSKKNEESGGNKVIVTEKRNPTGRGLILRPGINVGQVKDEFFLPY